MKRPGVRILWALCAILCAHATAAERITTAELASSALGRSLPVAVVAPETVSPVGEVPVLFLLHGRGRHHRSLVDSPAARAALLTAPFYVVLPQGEDGWYLDSPAQPTARYAAYLAEVVAWAERTLPVGHTAARRGIAGWSMGGYGAVHFAETHPGKFGFVASVIGLLDFPRAETLPEGQNYRVPVARFTADPATWATLNPLNHVERLRGVALTLVLATKGFELTMNENFIAALAARTPPLPARVHRLEGGHEFSLVERAIPLVLADAAEFFHKESAIPSRPTP
jgi:S-formylglutathione hydrolase FrmB